MNKKNKTLYDLRKLKQLKKKKVLLYRLYLQGLDNEIEEMGFKEMKGSITEEQWLLIQRIHHSKNIFYRL